MATTRQSRDTQSLTGLILLPLAVLVCCGTGLVSAVIGVAGISAALINPWLIAPAVLGAAALVGLARRRRARCATPSSLSMPSDSAGSSR